jgi:hypothetical protein
MKRIILHLGIIAFFLIQTASVLAQVTPGSVLASSADNVQLATWLGNNPSGTLLYRRSVNGASAATFHSLCDNQGPTIVLYKTVNNTVFGGYNANSWSSSNGYMASTTNFLFNLTTAKRGLIGGIVGAAGTYATYNTSSYGPTWGGGHDLYFDNNMNGVYVNTGHTYNTLDGSSYNTVAAATALVGPGLTSISFPANFITEIEVYKITYTPANTLNNIGLSSATPALAAYSLRKLSTAYTGAAIRVRRSSDNAEADVAFDGSGLVSATSVVTIKVVGTSGLTLNSTQSFSTFYASANGFVSILYDQSGKGYNATQTTAANQPQIVASGVITTSSFLNNKPCLTFDASAGRYMTIPFASTLINATGTFATVHSQGTLQSGFNAILAWTSAGSVFGPGFAPLTSGGSFGLYTTFGTNSFLDMGPIVSNKGYVMNAAWTGNGGSITESRNGTVFTGSVPQHFVSTVGNGLIGQDNGTAFTGSIPEMIVFATALGTADRQAMENNQIAYYTPPVITTGAISGTIVGCVGTASASPNVQQFNVSGVYLTANMVVTAPTGFEVSTTLGSGYGSSVTLTQTNGTVNSTTIYVRSSSAATTGTVSGNVSVSSGAATPGTAAVSATISALPTPTIYASGATAFCAGGSVNLNVSALGNAMQMSGTQYAQSNNPALPLGNASRTIEAWVKTTTATNGVVANWGQPFTNQRSGLIVVGNHIYYVGENNDLSGSINISDGSWHHIAATFDGTTLKLYVDGVLDGSSTKSFNTTGTTLRIGQRSLGDAGSELFNGTIEELRIWNVARTQAQLLANRFAEIPANSTGLVAYYKMNETTGLSLTDASINNVTSTLTAAANWIPSNAPGSFNTYSWSPGGATTSSIVANTTGNYTVTVTNANGCVATSGAVAVTANPLPLVYNVTGGGISCGTGVAIGLDGSQTGVNYQLKNGSSNVGSAVAGTNTAITFGSQSAAGTYTVIATGAGNCTTTMTGSAVVTTGVAPSFTNTNSSLQGTTSVSTCSIAVSYALSASGSPSLSYVFTGATTGTGTGTGSGALFNTGVTNVSVTASNSCGTVVNNFTVTIKDNTAPVLTGAPSNIIAECSAVPAMANVTASDNCSVSGTVNAEQFPASTLKASLVHNYTFNSSPADSKGSANGTNVNGVSFAPGIIGNAAQFNGTNHLDYGTAASLNGSIPFAISVWIKTASAGQQTIIQQRDGNVNGQYILNIGANHAGNISVPGQVYFMVYNNTFQFEIYSSSRVDDNKWHHIVAERDGTNGRIFIDGVLAGSGTGPLLSLTSSIGTYVGRDVRDGSKNFVGQIDELKIFAGSATNNSSNYDLERTWSVTDASGNMSAAQQIISVQDTQAPTLSAAPADITIQCSGQVPAAATVTATDNCDASPAVVYTEVRTNGANANNYTLTRTWKATDASGNASTKTQIITVQDTQLPVITAPSNVTVTLSNGNCTASGVALGTPVTSDNCGVASVTNDAPATYSLGNTTVIWTVRDISGNAATTTQTVSVVSAEINIAGNNVSIAKGDQTPAANDNTDFGSLATNITVSKTFTIQNTGNASLTISSVNVSGTNAAEFTVSGVTFPLVIAANSNANFGINFISNATGNRSATITVTNDDCDEASYDFAVKAVTTCTAPSFGNINVYIQNSTGTNGCTAVVNYPLSVNGVPAPAVTYTFSGATTGTGVGTGSGQVFNKGITHVVVTATNACGTQTAAFDVTVVDNVKPVVVTKNNTIYLDATGRATLNASSIDNGSSDNCGTVSFTTNSNGIICATAAEGSYLTLTAPAGKVITGINFASYGTPTGSCGSFVTGSCHASNSLSVVSALAIGRNSVTIGALNSIFTDPCNGTVKRLYVEATYASTGTSNTFTCSKLGNNEVTLIVTDADGNTESGTAIVTVLDSTKPVVRTRNLTLCLDANGNANITPAMIENGSTDNCSIVSYSLSQTSFNNSHVGVNTVTLSVRDASGNIGTATATVTINALPVVYTVTGGGAYCQGSEGVAVGLSNSQAGITYNLYNSNGNVTTVTGTGSAINFGVQTVAGTYTVYATNPAGGCGNYMSGSVSVTINTVPVITITPAASTICAGNSVVLTAAQTQSQTRTYKVALEDLLNTYNNCGGDSWYGNDQPGFRWFDEGTGTVSNVKIQFSMGVECNNGMIHTGYLNNWAQSAYFSQVSSWCSCGAPPTPAIVTLNMNGDGYNVGGENTFNIYNEYYNWIGFIPDASLDNSFALITVTYDGGGASGNVNNWVWTPGAANTASITVNPAATTSYTVTGTDENGCRASASATITVNPLPAVQTVTGGGITCGAGVAIGLTGSQSGIRYQLRRNGSNTGSPVNGNGNAINFAAQSVIGTYTVVATNVSTGCTAVMSGNAVITSGTAPVFANTNASVQAFATATTCNATVTYPLSMSGTPAPTVNYTFTGVTTGSGTGTGSGAIFNKGVTHVAVIAVNGCGTRNYNFDVTVTDNRVPTITAPAAIAVNTDEGKCGATVNLGNAATSDNCGVASVTNNAANFTTNGLFPVGTTTVIWTVTDNSGLTATATQLVVVTDHEKPVPVIAVLPVITGECSAIVTAPTATDNCAGTITATTNDPLIYNEQGVYTITWTYTDTHNNTETQTQTVIVKDITAPTITCPGNINVIATSAAGAVVNYTTPVTADNCSVVSSVRTTGLESGLTFPIGTTTVTYTVTDIAGLTATCSFDVTVAGLPPQIVCPQNIVVNNDPTKCGAIVNFAATETTAIPASTITYSIAPGSFFPIGTTTVTATATNAVGVSVCTFTITVVDAEKPTITAPGEYGVVNSPGQCGAILTSIGIPETWDNCGVASVTNDHPSTFYPVGETIVTWTVTDIHGNVTDTAKQTIIVIDNERPIVITQNITIHLDANGAASITAQQIDNHSTDNCGIASVTLNKTTFNCSNTGANTVILTVTDIHGHIATKTAIVTVQDMISPVLVGVPANSTVECNAIPVVATVTATDNCTASADITITQTNVSTYSADPSNVLHYNYVISRTWRATDASGNYSESVQTITVRDLTAPVITCPASVTLNCQDNNTSATTGVAIATDICTGSTNITITQTDASTYSADPSNVLHYNYVISRTWRATDVAGNYSECLQTITVHDITKPVLTVPANVSVVCSAPITPAATGMATGTDNCAAPSISYTDAVSSNGLQVTRTWKAMDVAGNFVTGVQVITIIPLSVSIASLPTSNIYTGGNNTNLYIGYGAQSTVLQVNASSQPAAGAPYTYSWSGTNLSQLSSISSSAPVFTVGNAGGYYTYVVTITNRYGCSKTASISLCITDVRVAGSNGKVYVCHLPPGNPGNRQTLSISVNAVDAHLSGHSGDRLGSCDQTPCNNITVANSIANATSKATKEGDATVATSEEELKVTVMPNPSTTFFTLKLESKYETPVTLRVMDGAGRVVDAKSKIGSNSTLQIGHNYSSGIYYAELIQGTKRKVVQLIKGRG